MAEQNKRVIKILKVLFLLMVIYLILRTIPTFITGNSQTIKVDVDNLSESIETEAVLIKNEKIYEATNNGELEKQVDEGSRVPAGSKVLTLLSTSGSEVIEEELKQIDQSINELNKLKEEIGEIAGDESNSEELINNLEKEIQNSIKNSSYEKIPIIKERIELAKNAKGEKVDDSEETLEQLIERRDNLAAELSKNVKDYYIDQGGIISYKIDEVENYFQGNDFEKYSYDEIKENLNKVNKYITGKEVSINEPVFKIIDNFQWYLGIMIPNLKEIEDIEEDNYMRVKLIDQHKEYVGQVMSINKFKNKGVIVLKFTEGLHEFYDERVLKVELIKSKVRGFKIPKEAVITQDGKEGVYIKDVSNVVRFREINILGEDEKSFYIESGDEKGIIYLEEGNIRTITKFDEVFINPNSVKEGKIIY